MLESLLFFFAVGVACELAAINRNGRKTIKQQAGEKKLKRKKTTGHRRSSFLYKGKGTQSYTSVAA